VIIVKHVQAHIGGTVADTTDPDLKVPSDREAKKLRQHDLSLAQFLT
jgi:hypothetical protein